MTTMLDAALFQPEPEPRAVAYAVISVGDHVVEPEPGQAVPSPAAHGGACS
ncbi:MAG: hypothetical protein QOE61_5341 [Micromonosporaceae bacterium]|jgi:hypothetical protein|nr:hypothetical protein [Micromonosporaceae bacterium]